MLHTKRFTILNIIKYDENFDDSSILPFLIKPLNDPSREQVQFCHNLIVNLFEKGISPCKQEFPEVQIKRQILDHYLKNICNITSQYGIYTIETKSPKQIHQKHQIQTDDIDMEFSKIFTDYIKNIQHQNSQRTNSIFTNDVFSNIYSYLSILELRETQGDSPIQTSRHTAVGQEITTFSKLLSTIRENLTNNEISQNVKHDLQKLLAWFINDYFAHNRDLISVARKNFQTQN